MSAAGLILAAGESRRMGSPKALLEYRGETFLARLVRLFAARCSPVIVVLGARAEEIRAATGLIAARFVVNEDWAAGQTGSMKRGLREAPADSDGVLFSLVDHPAVAPETIDALLAGAGRLRVPRYDGRRGHPIWFARDLISEFLALPAEGAARDVVRAHRAETEWVDVADPGILADIDDRAAYRALTGVDA